MYIEKEENNIKWYKEKDLRVRVNTLGENSVVLVTLNYYNISLQLVIYEIIEKVKDDILLDISINKNWNNQGGFLVNTKYIDEFVNYLFEYINIWDISVTKETVQEREFISEKFWYSL